MTTTPFELSLPILGPWRKGNTGVEGVWRFDSGNPGRELLLTALVHGNEICGAWALLDLLSLGVRPQRGAVTLAFCNLAAFDTMDVLNSDASRFVEKDFNRVWGSALQSATPTSAEQRRARELAPIVERADWLLDLHSMHEPGPPLMLTGMLPRNIRWAQQLAAPALVIADLGHRDGVRMRDHQQFDDPSSDKQSLLLECGWHGADSSRTSARDAIARVLNASQLFDDTSAWAPWLMADGANQTAHVVTHAVVARSMNTTFASNWGYGQRVAKAGTVLGSLDDERFVTPYDDCVLIMPSLRQLRPGVTVMRLAQAQTT